MYAQKVRVSNTDWRLLALPNARCELTIEISLRHIVCHVAQKAYKS